MAGSRPSNIPNPGTEPTFSKMRGAMTTRSTRRIGPHCTLIVLGLMAAFSKLVGALRMARSERSAR